MLLYNSSLRTWKALKLRQYFLLTLPKKKRFNQFMFCLELFSTASTKNTKISSRFRRVDNIHKNEEGPSCLTILWGTVSTLSVWKLRQKGNVLDKEINLLIKAYNTVPDHQIEDSCIVLLLTDTHLKRKGKVETREIAQSLRL